MAVSAAEAWLRQEKVKKFEDFVDRRLKPDLVSAISQRDKLFQQQKTLPDTRHIFVDIGLGFHVEFTWQEALQFISVREARLSRQIDEYTHLIGSIKAQIKLQGMVAILEHPSSDSRSLAFEDGDIASRTDHSHGNAGDFRLLGSGGRRRCSSLTFPTSVAPQMEGDGSQAYGLYSLLLFFLAFMKLDLHVIHGEEHQGVQKLCQTREQSKESILATHLVALQVATMPWV
ncbi:hypothetical protein ABZP36_002640 [Zizania latifolia]